MERSTPYLRFPVLLLTMPLTILLAAPVVAQDIAPTFWRADPATPACWFINANWTGEVPTPSTVARIDNGGTAIIHGPDALAATAAALYLGGADRGTVSQEGGGLHVTGDTWLGYADPSVILSAIWPPPYQYGGTYALSDGLLSTANGYISSGQPYYPYAGILPPHHSLFRQTGGRSEFRDTLHVGSVAAPYLTDPTATDPAASDVRIDPDYPFRPGAMLNLSGGVLSARRAYVGYEGPGRVIQYGESLAAFGALFVGGGMAQYYPIPMEPNRPTLDSLNVYRWRVGGAYAVRAGRVEAGSIHVGQRGTGSFTQTGGSVDVKRTLQVGGNRWWYIDSDGIDRMAADANDDTMISPTAPQYYRPANGRYTLADGELATAETEIGVGGVGVFTQTGGSHKIDQTLRIGGHGYPIMTLGPAIGEPTAGDAGILPDDCYAPYPYPGPAAGSYNLSGGRVIAERLELGAGYATWPVDWLADPAAVTGAEWAPMPWRPATFTQTGGEARFAKEVRILGGRYHLSDGRLTAGSIHLSDDNHYVYNYSGSTFTQTGGGVHIDRGLFLGPELSVYTTDPNGLTDPQFAPVYGRYAYTISDGSLSTPLIHLTGRGQATFTQTGGRVIAGRSVQIVGDNAAYSITGGYLGAPVVQVGRLLGSSNTRGNRLHVGPKAQIRITDQLIFASDARYEAPDGAKIVMAGASFANYSTRSEAVAGLADTAMIFSIGPEDDLTWETFEVAGKDLGFTRAGFWNNFVLDTLILGGEDVGELLLVDLFDNQPDYADYDRPEALYVRNLVVGPGSRLDLNGLHLYYLCSDIADDDSIIGGLVDRVSAAEWAHPGDSNFDGVVDLEDFMTLKQNFGRDDGVHWGHGDFDENGRVDLADFALLKAQFGTGGADVPEPATLALLLAGGAIMLRRRRK